MPITTHYNESNYYKDESLIFEIVYSLINICDELWVFVGDLGISRKMQKEINYANNCNKHIRYFGVTNLIEKL